jgi:hypothetical protein
MISWTNIPPQVVLFQESIFSTITEKVKNEAVETHHIHPELLRHRVRVLVVGCGGNGSAIAAGLPYLHRHCWHTDNPDGLHVTLLDPDVISPTNCVRHSLCPNRESTGSSSV